MKNVKDGKSIHSISNLYLYRVEELNEKASPEIIITIVGNKIDLENHAVSKEEAEAYCQKQGL